MNAPELGKLIEGDAGRDAVHVAVAPVTAGQRLSPGWRVGLDGDGRAVSCVRVEDVVGVVDPFLCGDVAEGDRFWLCLLPGSVTSLRHVWTHAAFRLKAPTITRGGEGGGDDR